MDKTEEALRHMGSAQYDRSNAPRENKPWYNYKYKVLNAAPGSQLSEDQKGKLALNTEIVTRDNGKYSKHNTIEIVDSVRAVILFTSHLRALGRGAGQNYRTVCESNDGESPSLRVEKPLCRQTKAEDLVQIFKNWKGYDEAKITAKIGQVTEGGTLKVCGIPVPGGFIDLCPFSNKVKNPITGQAGPCVQKIRLYGYDTQRDRMFTMDLTGNSIVYNLKYKAPFHEFTAMCAKEDKPFTDFEVTLTSKPNLSASGEPRGYYLDWLDLGNSPEDKRELLQQKAQKAAEQHDRWEAQVRPKAAQPGPIEAEAPQIQRKTDEVTFEDLAEGLD